MKTTSRYSHNGLTNTVFTTTAGLSSETIKRFLLICLALLVISCASGHHKPFDDTVVAKRNIAVIEERLQDSVSSSSHLSNDKVFSTKIVDTIQKMKYPIEQNANMVILKTENGIIDAPMLDLWYMKLTGQLSVSNYYRLNNSRHVFTIETPTRLSFEDRRLIQQTVIDTFINEYGDHR